MKKKANLLGLVLLVLITLTSFAASTVGVFSTWDADLMNVENVPQSGVGVYVAVLDSGLAPNWAEYFPKERVATHLGTGFSQQIIFKVANLNPCGISASVGKLQQSSWIGSTGSTHGTHVVSTILGYDYYSNFDALAGFPLPPITVRGIAPNATIIPVKVLSDYQLPALLKCDDPGPIPSQKVVMGTDETVIAGVRYVTGLAKAGYRPMVINLSLGGSELSAAEKTAIDDAIANGVIVVAASGNAGESGMSYPAAYAPVISVGAAGWTKEFLKPTDGKPAYRMWWLKYPFAPLLPNSGDTADPTSANDLYVTEFSSRALDAQQLDVLAPGSWVRGPFPGFPGYSRLPWHSKGIGDLLGAQTNFFYVGGTSMASPHVAALATLMLQKNPTLTQAQVETIMKSTALPVPPNGSKNIYDFDHEATISWDGNCGGEPCDAVGAGFVRVDAAIAATP
jgi:subtilisin family serine protease